MFLVYFRLFFSSFIKHFCPGLLISTTRTFLPGVLHSQLIFYFNFNCHCLKFSGFRSCALSPNVLQDDHCWVFLSMKGFSLGLTCISQAQNEVCKVWHLPTRTPGAMLALGFKSCPSIWLNNYLMGPFDRQEQSSFCKLKQLFLVCLKLKYSGKRDLRKDSSALLCPACPNAHRYFLGILYRKRQWKCADGSVQTCSCFSIATGSSSQSKYPREVVNKARASCLCWCGNFLVFGLWLQHNQQWRCRVTPDKREGLHTDTWQV